VKLLILVELIRITSGVETVKVVLKERMVRARQIMPALETITILTNFDLKGKLNIVNFIRICQVKYSL
jgi:hypothetical protein